jgi:hypothetical protein
MEAAQEAQEVVGKMDGGSACAVRTEVQEIAGVGAGSAGAAGGVARVLILSY